MSSSPASTTLPALEQQLSKYFTEFFDKLVDVPHRFPGYWIRCWVFEKSTTTPEALLAFRRVFSEPPAPWVLRKCFPHDDRITFMYRHPDGTDVDVFFDTERIGQEIYPISDSRRPDLQFTIPDAYFNL